MGGCQEGCELRMFCNYIYCVADPDLLRNMLLPYHLIVKDEQWSFKNDERLMIPYVLNGLRGTLQSVPETTPGHLDVVPPTLNETEMMKKTTTVLMDAFEPSRNETMILVVRDVHFKRRKGPSKKKLN